MARRRINKVVRRNPDAVYQSVLVTQLINYLMTRGKKALAERVVYKALNEFGLKLKLDKEKVLEKLDESLDNIRPPVKVRPRRVGGATLQIPVSVPPDKQTSFALRWLIAAARERTEKSMYLRLSSELLDALNNTGGAVKERTRALSMAEANKAFAHFSD